MTTILEVLTQNYHSVGYIFRSRDCILNGEQLRMQAIHSVNVFLGRVANHCDEVRGQIVTKVTKRLHLPPKFAYLLDRISRAVPETFVSICALFGGPIVFPASILGWSKKIVPFSPLISAILYRKFKWEELKVGWDESWKQMGEYTDKYLTPAFLVAMSIYTVALITMSILTLDFSKMFFATTICFGGTMLAFRHIMNQYQPPDSP